MPAHRVRTGHIARRTLTILLLLSLLGAWSPRPVVYAEQTQIPPEEYAALEALYLATDGANWTNKWTIPTDDPCGLYGVTCVLGHIATIRLYNNGLVGSVPHELGQLHSLTDLTLGGNQLSGQVPDSLGDLLQLWSLSLIQNQLTGPFPASLCNITGLGYLQLSDNDLSGSIPACLGSMVNLRTLNLDHNQLSGPIPPELGNLSLLNRISLASNHLTGSIPGDLGRLALLQWLGLGNNELSGPIPFQLGSLTALVSLGLSGNNLSGSIPESLGSLSGLLYLHLDQNQLSGPIPPELGNPGRLILLRLTGNQLSGEIPWNLAKSQYLQVLDLDHNQLTGGIPAWTSAPSLGRLILSHNLLTLPIPPELGNLTALKELDVSHNRMPGPVPSTITNLVHLGESGYSGQWLVDFGYNALWTDDPAVTAFLDAKDPDWAETQGVAEPITVVEGGELTLDAPDGSSLTVTVPAGAVSEPVTLVAIPAEDPATTPGTLSFAGQAFTLQAYRDDLLVEGLAFDPPVKVSVTYTDNQIAGLDEASLALYVWEDPAWVDAATTCTPPSVYLREPELNRLSVDICHLSEYALFGAPTDPYPFKVYLPLVKR